MRQHKYFIAILPTLDISDRITALRRKYLQGINQGDEHKKFPHITLQHTFTRQESIESELATCLNELSLSVKPFPVELGGIGHFGGRVIYVEVLKSEVLIGLHLAVKNIMLEKFHFSQKEVAHDFSPHITLEKKLSGENFPFFWKSIRDARMDDSFIADSFSLLRHTGIKWEVIGNYMFRN